MDRTWIKIKNIGKDWWTDPTLKRFNKWVSDMSVVLGFFCIGALAANLLTGISKTIGIALMVLVGLALFTPSMEE